MGLKKRQACLSAVVVVLSMGLAACAGSQIDPETAARMFRETAPETAPGTAAGPGGVGVDTTTGVPVVDGPPADDAVAVDAGGGGVVEGATRGTGGRGPAQGTGANSAGGARAGGSCAGLRNQTGITDTEVVVANVSDISGPVPGLFAAARDGARAYVAYFNATNKFCGRSLRLLEIDSRTDAGGDQVGYTRACSEAFAVVGSTSVLDVGGAKTAQACGIPDLRGVSLSTERARCTVCFPMQSSRTGFYGDGPYKEMRRQNKAMTESAAFLYLNTGGGPVLAKGYADVARSAGWNVKMVAGIDTTEFNYSPYVQQMKSLGIRYVHFISATPQAARLAQAMQSSDFKPEIYQLSQTQYTQEYVDLAGTAAGNTLIALPHDLFTRPNAEMKLYLAWLQQVHPGTDPSTFGVYAWSAMRMFVEKAVLLGGKLTRPALLAEVKKERTWTANGLHLAMDVGGKDTYRCAYFTRLAGGTWRHDPVKPVCGTIIKTSQAG